MTKDDEPKSASDRVADVVEEMAPRIVEALERMNFVLEVILCGQLMRIANALEESNESE